MTAITYAEAICNARPRLAWQISEQSNRTILTIVYLHADYADVVSSNFRRKNSLNQSQNTAIILGQLYIRQGKLGEVE